MDEAQLEGLEKARKGQMEMAQEEDAPPEEGPEAAAGLKLGTPLQYIRAPSHMVPRGQGLSHDHHRIKVGAWGSGILTGSS